MWAALLPAGELLGAVLLAARWSRPCGIVAIVALHLGLVAILGPWGLDHRWGVLIWNAACIAQVLCLFIGTTDYAAAASRRLKLLPVRPTDRLVIAPLGIALVMPVAEAWGLWDSWLAWGLYSTRASKVELYVATTVVPQLPPLARRYCHDTQQRAFWRRIQFDRWSLEELQAPIYPSARFQLGASLAVIESLAPVDRQFLLILVSAPDRRTGQVKTRRFLDLASVQAMEREFLLNVQPRRQSSGVPGWTIATRAANTATRPHAALFPAGPG
jgi:hypothetical protein